MPHRRRLIRLMFGAAAVLVGGYETWSVFVRETPAVTIQGNHLKAADEFGEGVPISQTFGMSASGLSSVEVQFSTDRPLNLMIRCDLLESDGLGSTRERLVASQFTTLKQVSGVEWRRLSFATVETSLKRGYRLQLDLVGAVAANDDSAQRSGEAAPERRPRVAVMVSTDNVFGGGAMWIGDRRQLGSLSLRAFSRLRTAFERFRTDVAPSLPRELQSGLVEVAIAVGYQVALLTVLYALLVGDAGRDRRR